MLEKQEKLIEFFKDRKVLITGAAGSIGSALAKRVAQLKPLQLILLDQDETGIFDIYEELKNKCKVDYIICSIRDTEKIQRMFAIYKPNIIYHTAAYKHVVLMEHWPDEAFKTNIEGTKNLVKAAIENKTERFIFVSSDKAVNPKCVMGRTKKKGEEICLGANNISTNKTKFSVVRFGNVMPSRGSVVPIFQKLIAEGKNLTVTSRKMKRYFMGIYDAANLILQVTLMNGSIFILDMGKQITIESLAKLMIKLSGKDLHVIYTKPSKGEKFNEKLMTKEETKVAKKVNGIYVI